MVQNKATQSTEFDPKCVVGLIFHATKCEGILFKSWTIFTDNLKLKTINIV